MTAPTEERAQVLTTIPASAMTVTNWCKQNVYEPNGVTVGEVDALIMSVGEFLGMGEKSVAVPFDSVASATRDGKMRRTMSATKELLQTTPAVQHDRCRTAWVFASNN